MKALTQDQAAALVGLTSRRIRQMVAEGSGPEVTPDGRFMPAPFGQWLFQRHKEEFGVSGDGHAYDYDAERGRLTKAQADLAEIELAKARGEVVIALKVSEAWIERIASARARLILLPPTIAPRVATPDRIAEVQSLIQDLVYEALNELASDGLPSGDSENLSSDDDDMEGAAAVDRKPVGRQRKAALQ